MTRSVSPFVLFLDFDGVLHPRTSGTCRHLPALEQVLQRHPHVQVVVSSTWKHQNTLEDLRGWFSPHLQHRVVDVTPDVSPCAFQRQVEIQAWLDHHPAQHWLALDDEPALYRPNCPWLLLTDPTTGLTSDDLKNLELRLQA